MPGNQDGSSPHFARLIAALPPSTPFVAPEALERQTGSPIRLRLGANESAFGMSPVTTEAMQQAAVSSNWYGDPESFELRRALAQKHHVSENNIVVGNGIDGLLGYVVRAFVDPQSKVITSLGTYPTFAYHVIAAGGKLVRVPYDGDRPDLQALLDAAKRDEARLVYLANPDNPSGGWQKSNDLVGFIDQLPRSTMLVLDEAYAEFAPSDGIVPINTAWRNVVRVRTFSKVHGMAGARIGYAIAATDVIDAIGKFRNQFEVSRVSQAGALAALENESFVKSVIGAVDEGRRDLVGLASVLGLSTLPSATNFVCIDVGGPERAKRIVAALLERGVFIRMPGEAPLNRCVRVTIGTIEQRAQFSEVFSDVMQRL